MLNELVSKWVEAGSLPGASMLVTQNGRIEHSLNVGFRSLEDSLPVTEETLFRLGSSTKIFVSVAALRLIEKYGVKLDDPLAKYLPEFSDTRVFRADGSVSLSENQILIVDLLRHTCGYGYGSKDPYRAAMMEKNLMKVDGLGFDDWSHPYSLRHWARALTQLPMESEPGQSVSYGLGHDLLGALIEVVSGCPLDEFVQAEVLAPLGLSDTFFVIPKSRIADLTSFYNAVDDELILLETPDQSLFTTRPAAFSGGGGWDMLGNGGLVTTARNFISLMQMILDGGACCGEQIFQPELISLLRSGQTSQLPQPYMVPGCFYSYGFASVDDATAHPRGPVGKMWWGGSTNTFYFFTPADNRCGIFMTHTFPFGHKNFVYQFDKHAS